jgi:hypothetical protein
MSRHFTYMPCDYFQHYIGTSESRVASCAEVTLVYEEVDSTPEKKNQTSYHSRVSKL